MKCVIIPENCIACGLCQVIAPDFFDYDEEGIVLFPLDPGAVHQYVNEEHQKAVVLASRKCPAHAILIDRENSK